MNFPRCRSHRENGDAPVNGIETYDLLLVVSVGAVIGWRSSLLPYADHDAGYMPYYGSLAHPES